MLALVFCSMMGITVGTHGTFVSPDENANAFFARNFAENLTFCAVEPLNDVAQGLLHPRSVVAPGTCLLPATFLGFPVVAGVMQFFFGEVGMLVTTPMLAVAAVLAWWWVVRRLTKQEDYADYAALLLLTHPAFWYYSGRVMMHNVAFVACLLLGIALYIYAYDRRSYRVAGMSGVVTALALTMRLVEAPIFFLVVGMVMGAYWRDLPRKFLVVVAMGGTIVFAAYGVMNYQAYGSLFATGYTLIDARSIGSALPQSASVVSYARTIGELLLPFGFHPRAIISNVWHYGVALYPVISLLVAIGLIKAGLMSKRSKGWRVFLLGFTLAALWMGVVYGSWSMADNPDPRAITIGNSHVRYWLPVLAASTLLAALGVQACVQFLQQYWKSRLVPMLFLLIVVGTSGWVVFAGADGFVAIRRALITFAEKRDAIIALTPDNAVVVVDRADKYLFPSRRVIVPLRSEQTYAILPILADHVPVYYFGITFPERDMTYLHQEKLRVLGLDIALIATMHEESLYYIYLLDDQEDAEK